MCRLIWERQKDAHKRLFRDRGSLPNSRFSIWQNSIMRRSFLRSSLGLHRKLFSAPSLSTMVSFFGF